VVIGTTTPLAGAFTTLSATVSTNTSPSMAGDAISIASSSNGSSAAAGFFTTNNASYRGFFQTNSSTNTSYAGVHSTNFGSYQNQPVGVVVNNALVGTFSSTGLNSTAIGATTPSTGAFTTLSATGQIRSSGVVSTNSVGLALGYSGANVSLIGAWGSSGATRGILSFYLSDVAGTVGNEYMRLNDTGLAVTGTLSATGAIKSTGANLANEADCVKLSFEGTSASAINAYGTDASTAGSFAINSKSSNGSVSGTIISGKAAQTLALEGASRSSGTGITFPATQSASTDVNTLDDYEEGTWTPNQGSGLTVVGAFSSIGRYTKVGNLVTVWGQVTGATSIAVSAAGFITTNLPFAIQTDVGATGIATGVFSTSNSASFISVGATTSVYSSQAISGTANITFTNTYRF
jgi:hypothetical protein